jgi:NAD(P)-dependent dehydrogenase (short-subunit alcohol dehydrogenase family)
MMTAYPQSKMANLLFTVELAKRLEGTGVTANIADPGFTATNLGRDARGEFKEFLERARPTTRTPEKSAETAIYLASAPEVEKVNGTLFRDKRETGMPRVDPADVQRLWKISAELTGVEA